MNAQTQAGEKREGSDLTVEIAPRTSIGRVPELDGLRGIAVLSVMLMHYFYDPTPGLPKFIALLQRPFALGWSGVDLFFVLSGFLIGGILMDHRESRSYFKTFYARRFFRIIPLYYLWITLFIVFILGAGPILSEHTRSGTLPPIDFGILRHYLFLQNLWIVDYVTVAYWWFGPMWSLAVEEQFYLAAPLLVRYVAKRLLPAILAVVVCAAPLVRLWVRAVVPSGQVPWLAYQLMPCRMDALALGMLAAYLWRKPGFPEALKANAGRLYAVLAALFVGVLYIWWWHPNPNDFFTQTFGYTLLALFYCVLLLTSIGMTKGPIARLMRLRTLRECGRVSYCMYLIHLTVGFFCFGFLERRIIHFTDWRSGAVGLLSIAVTFAVASVSWRFFEGPLLRRGHRFNY